MDWSRQQIEDMIVQSLKDVYDIMRYSNKPSDKQAQFINLLTVRLLGQDDSKWATGKASDTEKAVAEVSLECPKCGKKCKSRSGMTLHIKRHA